MWDTTSLHRLWIQNTGGEPSYRRYESNMFTMFTERWPAFIISINEIPIFKSVRCNQLVSENVQVDDNECSKLKWALKMCTTDRPFSPLMCVLSVCPGNYFRIHAVFTDSRSLNWIILNTLEGIVIHGYIWAFFLQICCHQ